MTVTTSLQSPPICYCQALMVLRSTQKFRHADGTPKRFYACTRPGCDGLAALHADGTLMSTAADKETRAIRHEAHQVFDKVWLTGLMCRNDAYHKLASVMGLTRELAHIGMFNIEQCQKVISVFDGITRAAIAADCRQREKHSRKRAHPWRFVTLIIWGGYREVLENGTRWRHTGTLLYRAATFKHRIEVKDPAWSLVWVGQKVRPWGFWSKLGWRAFVPGADRPICEAANGGRSWH